MIETVTAIIWWTGAVGIMALLALATFALGSLLKYINQAAWRWLCDLIPIASARYWVNRMEREGLTVCRDDYRKMVAERKPQTVTDYAAVERLHDAHGIKE